MNPWYRRSVAETLAELKTDAQQGLTPAEAARRFDEVGPNELVERGVRSPWLILAAQFKETMVIILIAAALISAALGDTKDAIAIVAIVIINAFLGFRQEYQAEKAMAALKKMAVPTVRVRRGGHLLEISARELVPGDLVLLEAGNTVPADCRLVETVNLRAAEAALTGESEPVAKDAAFAPQQDLALGDRLNMVYMGTAIAYGRGSGIVVATGMETELGAIADLMQSASSEQTPLQKRLDQLGKGLAVVALALVGVIFLIGLARGEELRLLFITSISIAVAAVPEGLPAVVTIALALGARRMLARQALIRKLPAVETLGSVTVICSDKTGTLTENRMTVTVLDVADHHIDLMQDEGRAGDMVQAAPCEPAAADALALEYLREYPALALMLAGGALCNDAVLECNPESGGQYSVVGDPTEGALVVAAAKSGMNQDALRASFPRAAEIPFDSERKRMTTVHRLPQAEGQVDPALRLLWQWGGWDKLTQGEYIAFTKGAVDSLLEVSDRVWTRDGGIEPLTPAWRERIVGANARLAQNGMRVLGLAVRTDTALPVAGDMAYERELVLVGMVGMIDPARPEVKEAVRTCKQAGIRPIMITGDHPLTAGYIAAELGIETLEKVVTGQDLEAMSAAQLEEVVKRASVYARVSPEHKLRIVEALQRQGEVAAMTGDGVNDAPALKTADIGIAMGITGTDVSKEAADMVLLNDNFATIVAAVEEGRVIYDNIRRFVKYLTSCNSGEVAVMIFGPLLGMPLPLLPLQILWMNLVTDGLPALALGVEPAEKDVMQRDPHPPSEGIFARGLARDIIWMGLLMAALTLAVGYTAWRANNPDWQTLVFTILTFSQMALALAVRSENYSIFQIGLLSNKPLLGAIALTTLLQFAVIYFPPLQNLLETEPLTLAEMLLAIGVGVLMLTVVEVVKWMRRIRARSQGIAV